ncbi:hypothetical protein C8R43DRAFT_960309 [Mycena crocata]|nr:hypothetical protein C8R43DRAFT_960309 [Mycena crocata]
MHASAAFLAPNLHTCQMVLWGPSYCAGPALAQLAAPYSPGDPKTAHSSPRTYSDSRPMDSNSDWAGKIANISLTRAIFRATILSADRHYALPVLPRTTNLHRRSRCTDLATPRNY